jgi:phosphonate transport system substrate-binding protein
MRIGSVVPQRLLLTSLIVVTALLLTISVPNHADTIKKEYLMGVFPHLPPRDLENVFGPMAKDFSGHLGKDVVLATSTTYERFSELLDDQKFDIAFVQPFEYVRIADRFGYLPLATRTEKLNGLVVTLADSPIKTIKDLKGKRIALPPESAAVSILIRNHLRAHGLVPDKDVTMTHHRSHVSCMQKVVIGEADACGTAAPSVRFFENKMQLHLKTITTSREIPSSLFVVHPRVPASQRAQLRDRIISWSNTEEGMAILNRGALTPFVATADADYNVVRELSK